MHGPDPFTIMAHAQIQVREHERTARHSFNRPWIDDAAELAATPAQNALTGALQSFRASFSHPLATLLRFIRPRAPATTA